MSDEAEPQESQFVNEHAQAALKPENVRQMKIAMATLAAGLVKAANEGDSQFEQRFVTLLDKAYDNYREYSDADPQHVLEAIHWTREMLKGWNPIPGRKGSIFSDGHGNADAAVD